MGEQFQSFPGYHGGDTLAPHPPPVTDHGHYSHHGHHNPPSMFTLPLHNGRRGGHGSGGVSGLTGLELLLRLPLRMIVFTVAVIFFSLFLVVLSEALYSLTAPVWTIAIQYGGVLWGVVTAACLILAALCVAMICTHSYAD